MVAITTDIPRHPAPRRSAPPAPGRHPTSSGEPLLPTSPAVRLALVVVALLVVVAVGVGTAAVGRVLDTQRGIPAAASADAP